MKNEAEIQNEQLKKNIELLEQGITLKEYLKREEEIKINGSTEIYNYYGFYVILDETRRLYLLDGGMNSKEDSWMENAIRTYLLDNKFKICRHYQKDEIILRFYKVDVGNQLSTKEYIEKANKQGYAFYEERFAEIESSLKNYYESKYKSLIMYNWHMSEKAGENAVRFRKLEKSNRAKMKSVAEPLLQLKNRSSFLYELLNAIVDLLVKPLPIFVWQLIMNKGYIFIGSNVIQKLLYGIFSILGMYLGSIMIYLGLFIVIKIITINANI